MNKGVIPLQWQSAKEIYIPKVNPPTAHNISDFCPIALLNVEGKLFFSLVSRRLEKHLINNNKFINKSVQKGCMEKVPGCWEHIPMVWAALKEAKSKNLSLATIWLDIANAYGSISHKLIIFALFRYGVSPKWIQLTETYYSGIFKKSFSQEAPSSWHRHQRGIFAGCTLSIILFLTGMNIILEYSLVTTTPQFHLNNVSLPPMRAFMDDLNIMSSTVCGTKTLLSSCTIALKRAGLTFRADKSRSIVIIKRRSMNATPFSVSSPKEPSDFTSFIPSIQSRPVRFLGQVIDGSIFDRNSLDELKKKLLDGLNIIDSSHFTGSQKLWFLQHLLIPRIQWPILIYEVPISLVSKLEQKASVYIRKRLKLHKSITSLLFYSSASPCPLLVRSLTSVLISSKISGHLLLRHSWDASVSSCVPKLQAGNWQVVKAVQACETDLKYKSIIGHHQHSRHGLGYIKTSKVPSDKSSRDYRTFISSHHKEIEDTYVISKSVQLKVQGQWTRWLNYIEQNFSWKSLLAMPISLTSFAYHQLMTLCLLQAILRDGNFLLRPPASCVIKTRVLHLTFLEHVKWL